MASLPLLSIFPNHKYHISTTCTLGANKVNTGILNINKYSNYEQLLRKTEYLFTFVSKFKGYGPKKKASEYWIKNAQAEYFDKEISFLKDNLDNNSSKNIPPLVLNLNMFIDENGILRSR